MKCLLNLDTGCYYCFINEYIRTDIEKKMYSGENSEF